MGTATRWLQISYILVFYYRLFISLSMSSMEHGDEIKDLLQLSASTLLLFANMQLANHADNQWISCTGQARVHSRTQQKNMINFEVIYVEVASLETNRVLFHVLFQSLLFSASSRYSVASVAQHFLLSYRRLTMRCRLSKCCF
jgi:hypothetical protein